MFSGERGGFINNIFIEKRIDGKSAEKNKTGPLFKLFLSESVKIQ